MAATQIATAFVLEVLLAHVHTWRQIKYLDYLGTWFLPVLFFAYIVIAALLQLSKNKNIVLLISALFIAAFHLIPDISFVYVNQTLVAVVFMFVGYQARPLLDKLMGLKNILKGCGWIGLLVCCILSTKNQPIAMYLNEYGNKTLFIFTSLLGILSIWDISISIKSSDFLRWCGRESIILYVLQFSVIRMVMTLLNRIMPGFAYNEYPFFLYTFLLVLIIIVPLTIFCNKYLGWAFGKTRAKL